MRSIRPDQIRTIHAIKTRAALHESDYRAMLQGYGVSTSKALTADLADRLITRMREIPGADQPKARAGRAQALGRYASKLQALWIALYNLGAVRNRSDSAMHAFLERQTGLSHSRFLQEPEAAAQAIEALKGWLTRVGVIWPEITRDKAVDIHAIKLAILRAQWRRGVALGVLTETEHQFGPDDSLRAYVSTVTRQSPRRLGTLDCPSLTNEELDKASSALGAKIRIAPRREVRRAG